jgi:hypothetical protein
MFREGDVDGAKLLQLISLLLIIKKMETLEAKYHSSKDNKNTSDYRK